MNRPVAKLRHERRSCGRILSVLAVSVLAAALSPTLATATSPGISSGTLVFMGARARTIGPANVAVPVKCLGGEAEFCAGAVTLMRNGHRHSVAFSVRGGSSESLFVTLRHGDWGTRPRKVRALASTTEPLGAPSQIRTLFYAR